jgi:ubiquinone/menaquinone biosynthesis C-methylase UbiE
VSLYIPPRAAVPKPNSDDPIDYYYRPVTGTIYRSRLRNAVELLGPTKFGALLEVGTGSGILLPELSRHTQRLVAIDIHDKLDEVREFLTKEGVDADVVHGSLFEMPFRDGEFDALFCASVLEHLTELDQALKEFARVVKPGGVLVLGFPVRNVVTDAFFRLAHFSPRDIHPSSHRDIEAAIRRSSDLEFLTRRPLPGMLPLDLSLYDVCKCRRR